MLFDGDPTKMDCPECERSGTSHTEENPLYISKNEGEIIKLPRTFGIEYEIGGGNLDQLAGNLPRAFHRVHDGSIQMNNPIEVVSPILAGDLGERAIFAVSEIIEKAGFTVNRSCGLHVHLGGSDMLGETFYRRVKAVQAERFVENLDKSTEIISVNFFQRGVRYQLNEGRNVLRSFVGERFRQTEFHQSPNTGRTVAYSTNKRKKIGGRSLPIVATCIITHERYMELSAIAKTQKSKGSLASSNTIMSEIVRKETDMDDGFYIFTLSSNANIVKARKMFGFYRAFDLVFRSMVPASRKDNQRYCRNLTEYDLSKILNSENFTDLELVWYSTSDPGEVKQRKREHRDSSRYHWVNLHSLFADHGTVEIRLHPGDTNARRILYWTSLHQHILDRVEKLKDSEIQEAANLKDLEHKARHMFEILDLPPKLDKYAKLLLAEFSKVQL